MKQKFIRIRFFSSEGSPQIFSVFLVFFFTLFLTFSEAVASTGANEVNKQGDSNTQEIITGKIVDESGFPLPGASVIEEGTSNGTVTNFDGEFQISVQGPDAILVINFLGYLEQRIPANQEDIFVQMQPNAATLDEVVVVGYGTAARRDVTGAVSSVTAENLNQGAMTNPLQQLTGRAAGVNVTQTGSEPGSSPSVRIRGITSLIGGNDPLVVVDGIQGNMDLLNQVPPGEIESIDILKDASATAIYGSRGAPGVIIVTTRAGKEGKLSVEYNASASADFIPRQLKVLDAQRWWEVARQTGVPASANHGSSTDWFDVLTQTGSTQNHTLSFGGGTRQLNYRASL